MVVKTMGQGILVAMAKSLSSEWGLFPSSLTWCVMVTVIFLNTVNQAICRNCIYHSFVF
jgi:hypothetical protein